MHRKTVTLSPKILIGITARTTNAAEMNPVTSKIGPMMQRYFAEQLMHKIQHRVHPGVTYSVYTEFASDEHGEYTYFLGEEVSDAQDQDLSLFREISIPSGVYQRFTTPVGAMPGVIIEAWQAIWNMSEQDFGGPRAYRADFEVYDHRALDPAHAVADIYIGIR